MSAPPGVTMHADCSERRHHDLPGPSAVAGPLQQLIVRQGRVLALDADDVDVSVRPESGRRRVDEHLHGGAGDRSGRGRAARGLPALFLVVELIDTISARGEQLGTARGVWHGVWIAAVGLERPGRRGGKKFLKVAPPSSERSIVAPDWANRLPVSLTASTLAGTNATGSCVQVAPASADLSRILPDASSFAVT